MALTINTNLMAATAARNLNNSYSALATSTSRLSSGLRINTAADDAAGLAVRELMRADIASLNQGVRNANDAISLIQTADGALQVIDEKLIRMKELAEQSGYRHLHLGPAPHHRFGIPGHGLGNHPNRQCHGFQRHLPAQRQPVLGTPTTVSGLTSTGKLKVHFGSGNLSAEDYYYVQVNTSTASAFGLGMGASTTDRAGRSISTQELAQLALEKINDAIVSKDKIPRQPGLPAKTGWRTPSPTWRSRPKTCRRPNPRFPTWTWPRK